MAVAFTLRCDRIVGPGGMTCGAALTMHTATAAGARREAAQLGWTHTAQADACPQHSRRTRAADVPSPAG